MVKQIQYYKKVRQSSMSDFSSTKVFPLRLPQNFHGPLLAKSSLVDRARAKLQDRLTINPQEIVLNKSITRWQRKRLDEDIKKQRREMLVHPGKESQEIPECFKTTYNFYRRNLVPPPIKKNRTQQESYDIFGRKKVIVFAEKPHLIINFPKPSEITHKIGSITRHRSILNRDVTPKIGSLESRDFSVPHHLIKIGKPDFINTYSIF